MHFVVKKVPRESGEGIVILLLFTCPRQNRKLIVISFLKLFS